MRNAPRARRDKLVADQAAVRAKVRLREVRPVGNGGQWQLVCPEVVGDGLAHVGVIGDRQNMRR